MIMNFNLKRAGKIGLGFAAPNQTNHLGSKWVWWIKRARKLLSKLNSNSGLDCFVFLQAVAAEASAAPW
jgi:hypothetical protein